MAKKKKAATRVDAAVDRAVNRDRYQRRKEREANRQRKIAAAGQDIAPIPKPKRPAQRKQLEESLKQFCEVCFPGKFKKRWSDDHLVAIKKMEKAIRHGDLFALAMPRGSGKTTLVVAAILWAILCGYRSYVALIGPTKKHAVKLLSAIKTELETNDTLYELWPEAVHPVRSLERIANRARGQKHNGDHTYIEWGKELIVLATIPNAPASSAIIEAVGITGSVRGMQQSSPDGKTRRPDLAVIDDPQTKQSARSLQQRETRLEVIQGDVLGLAGPGEPFAAFCLCTVVETDDVADQLLNHEKYPDWQGDRFQLVYSWPTDEKHWDEYATIRAEDLAAGNGTLRCNEYYRKHRKKMDAGAKVAWTERYDEKSELSAIQHAMNLRFRDPDAFAREYQNQPVNDAEDAELLSVEAIQAKLCGYSRGVVPPEADTISAFIDVQGQVFYWLALAIRASDFSCWVIDYGTWPEQPVKYFTLSSIRRTLAKQYPKMGLEGRLRAGLLDCVEHVAGREWKATDGRVERISRMAIDAAWGQSSKIVQAVCRESPHAAVLTPYFGRPVGASQKPIEEWAKQEGERRGFKWIIRPTKNTHGRHLLADVNAWKSFAHARLSTAAGDPGALCLFKPTSPIEHRMFAEHLRAETREKIRGDQRETDLWKLPPHKPDNHYLDCLTGSMVMGSVAGAALLAHRPSKPIKPRKKRKPNQKVSYL